MTIQTLPIVGAFYRPPAKAILDFLPIDCPLILRAEPTNDYDPNAIMVLLPTDHLPESSDLELALGNYGSAIALLQQQDEIHVGYLPRERAAILRALGFPEGVDIPATFSVGINGGPRVRFEDDFNG